MINITEILQSILKNYRNTSSLTPKRTPRIQAFAGSSVDLLFHIIFTENSSDLNGRKTTSNSSLLFTRALTLLDNDIIQSVSRTIQ